MESCGLGNVACRTWLNVRAGKRAAGFLGWLILSIVMQGSWVARAQDVTPPVLTGFSFSPSTIDTSSGPVTVTVNFTATDDLSGVQLVAAFFSAPIPSVGGPSNGIFFSPPATATSGSFALTFPRYSPAGVWKANVQAQDAVGNFTGLSPAALAGLGFPTDLTVTGTSDTTAPTLTAFSFTPSIDTTAGPVPLTVSFTATDNLAGVRSVSVTFTGPLPTTVLLTRSATKNFSSPFTTTVTDSVTITFPRFSPTGTWKVTSVRLTDGAGNFKTLSTADLTGMAFPTDLTVTGTGDSTLPALTSFSFSPSIIGVGSAAESVMVNFGVTDDLSGANRSDVLFFDPSLTQVQGNTAFFTASTSTSGSVLVTIPRYSALGVWTVFRVRVFDAAGNFRTLMTADLAALGFPTTLVVQGPCPPHTIHLHISTVPPSHSGNVSHEHHGQHGHTANPGCPPHAPGHSLGLMPEPEEGLFSQVGVPFGDEPEETITTDQSRIPLLLTAAEGAVRRGTILQLFVSAPAEAGETTIAGEPEVRIGDVAAQVISSALAPGPSGLRRLQVAVPANAPVGSAVPVAVFYPGVELPTTRVTVE